MTRTILAHVDGFTPLIDSIVVDLGVMAAAVFGKVWRYCQMEDQVCYASIATLANELNLSPDCIGDHLQELVREGYLAEVKRPGMTSVFQDTGKAGLSISLTAGEPTGNSGRTYRKNPEVPTGNSGTKKVLSKKESKKEGDAAKSAASPIPPESKKIDPRKDHPAIKAFREVTERFPHKSLWDKIIQVIGDSPQIEKLRGCFVEWVGKGYNPSGIGWLEWYTTGIPARPSGGGYSARPSQQFTHPGYNPGDPAQIALVAKNLAERREKAPAPVPAHLPDLPIPKTPVPCPDEVRAQIHTLLGVMGKPEALRDRA